MLTPRRRPGVVGGRAGVVAGQAGVIAMAEDLRTRLRCSVSTELGVAVVQVAGTLDLRGAAVLRSALARCLNSQPELVIVDVAEMEIGTAASVRVFAAAARRAASWPGCGLVLCRPAPDVVAALESTVACRHLAVHSSVEQALAAHTASPAVPQYRIRLAPLPVAPGQARRLVEEACREWGLAGVSDIAQLVLTELVTNAVRHAGTEIDVRVSRLRARMQVSVRDRSALKLRRGGSGEDGEGGRGLLVVEALSTAWGCGPTVDGKVVWALLACPGPGVA